MARLAANVAARNPDTGRVEVFEAGDDAPTWLVRRLSNPAVWADEPAPQGAERPPVAGRGSGRDAWAAYAASVGVEVDDGMSRDDIIEAVDDA